MRPLSFWILSLSLASAVVVAQETKEAKNVKTIDKVYFAKLTDRIGDDEYLVLSGDEFKAMQDEIALEDRLFARALSAADADWRKDETTRKQAFPKSAVKKRQLAVLQTFNDREAAEERLAAHDRSQAELAERHEAANKVRKAKRTKEQLAADAARESARLALSQQACSVFEAKLSELIAAKQPAAAP
jgi:DNA-binding transcriptional regulator YiaG